MKKKYVEAIQALTEVIIDQRKEIEWRDSSLNRQYAQISKLEAKIAELKKPVENSN